MATVYDDLADRIRSLVHRTVASRGGGGSVQRFKVISANPLVVEQIEGDLVLEEGDPDVDLVGALLADRPSIGDTVLVHADGEDWIIGAVIV